MILTNKSESSCKILLCNLIDADHHQLIDVTVALFDHYMQISLNLAIDQGLKYYLMHYDDIIGVEYSDKNLHSQRAILHLKNRDIQLKMHQEDTNTLRDLLRVRAPQSDFARLYKRKSIIRVLKNGEITECCCKLDGKVYIAKMMKNSSSDFIQREIQINKIMAINPHKNIMSMVEYFENDKEAILIFPYLRGGTLNHFMSTLQERARLQQMQVKKIMKQILKGLDHIHRLGIIHRDIKMDNIMIEEDNDESINVKIIDFGFAIKKNEVNESMERCGTVGYLAPEVIHYEQYTQNCDIFSLAQVFHILLTGNPMYDRNLASQQILQMTLHGQLKIDRELIHSQKAIDLLQNMIKPKGERFSVRECLNHEYFKEPKLIDMVHCLSNLEFKSPFEKEI